MADKKTTTTTTTTEKDKTLTEQAKDKVNDAAQWVKDKASEPCESCNNTTKICADSREAAYNAADKVQEKVKPEEKKTGEFEKSAPAHKELPTKASKKTDDKTLTEKVSDKATEAKETAKDKIFEAADWGKEKACEPCSGDQYKLGRDMKEGVYNAADKIQEKVKPEEKKTGDFEKSAPAQKELPTKASKKADDKTLGEKVSDTAGEAWKSTKETASDAAQWVKDKANTVSGSKETAEAKADIYNAADKVQREVKPESQKTVGEKVSDAAKDAKDWAANKLTPESQKTTGQKIQDKASDAADRIKAEIKPESEKTVMDKTKEAAHDLKEGTKDSINKAADYIKEKTS